MRLLLFLLLSASLYAQLPTNGLEIQYDMVTISGGTSLTDLSGNANHGTISGATAVASGLTFDGVNDYVFIPSVVKNSDFTVIVVKTGDINGGALWFEADPTVTSLMRVQNGSGATAQLYSSGGDSGGFGPSTPVWGPEYHAIYLQRATSTTSGIAITGIIDKPYRKSVPLTGTPNFSADSCAALGAQAFNASCASQNLFFTGTIAYVVIYTRMLSVAELATAYTAIKASLVSRPIFLQDLVTPKLTGPVWTSQGSAISGAAQEPSVIYDTANCVLVANPCQKMLYTRGLDIAYAESIDGSDWIVQGTSAITDRIAPAFLKVGSTYYAYVIPGTSDPDFTKWIDLYTSPNGATSWTLAQAAVISRDASGWERTGGNTGIYNSVVVNEDATHWYMMFSGNSNGCGVATSSDGITWVKGTANPINGNAPCQGPFLYHSSDGTWYMWTGSADTGTDGVTTSGIVRYQSAAFNDIWAVSAYHPLDAVTENLVSDPSIVEVAGMLYMYIGGTVPGNIKLFTAPLPLSQLIGTAEGRLTSAP